MKNKIITGAIAVALLIIGFYIGRINKVELKNGKEVVASITGKKITAEDLFDNLKEQGGNYTLVNMVDEYIVSKEIKDEKSAKEKASTTLEQYKEQYKQYGQDFEQVLKNAGYNSEDAFLDQLVLNEKKQEVVEKYIGKSISDDEIKTYYDENIFANMSAKHILITPESSDDDSTKEKNEKEAYELAKKVIEKLNDGEKFDDLVAEYSNDEGSKSNKGLIENFTKGDVVESFFNAALELKNDEYTKEPVKSEYGYHIILKVSQDKRPTLKESKDDIIDALVKQKLSEDSKLYNSTWKEIRNDYKLKIKDTFLKNEYNKTINE